MNYAAIELGAIYEFEHIITRQAGERFAELTGDRNRLHLDEAYGKKSPFGQNISHGMLAASLFSTLVGMHIPGEDGFYLSQTAQFKAPIFYDDLIVVRGTVAAKNDSIKVITLKTEIFKGGEIAVSGEAKVKLFL